MSAPTNPWKALDLVRGLRALPHVWEPILGEQLPAFKILCLQKTADIGGCVPCPACPCYHRITLLDDGTAATGACRCDPATCPDIPLTMEQVTLWQVNQPRLGRAVARALGCPPKIQELPQPNTFQFGSWSTDSVPVILTIQHDKSVFRRVIAELGLSLARPYILFAPTNADIDAKSQTLLAQAKATFFTLDATVRLIENGTLQAIKPAAELFAAFIPESERPSVRSTLDAPRYALRKGLGVWELYFDYERVLLKHERGIFYVHWLLYHPDQTPIHAIDLMAKIPEIYRQQLGLAPLVNPVTGKPVDLASHARLQERSLALDDRQAMRAILKKEKDLETILDSDDATEPEKTEALRELEQITELKRHYAKTSKSSARATAHAVRQAVNRLHSNLSSRADPNSNPNQILHRFAKHIHENLILLSAASRKTPGHFTYDPSSHTQWIT